MAVKGPNAANRDGLIGSLVTSDKPIAVNCGSFGGTNGEMSNLDLGFDQIVSAERTGTDYIFIRGTGQDNVERILLIAHEDNTEIYLSGSATPAYTINAGVYVTLDGGRLRCEWQFIRACIKKSFCLSKIWQLGFPSRSGESGNVFRSAAQLSDTESH